MVLFRRWRSRKGPKERPRDAQRATVEHFGQFVAAKVGVEAYVEPPTRVTPTTMVLVATTGEWTRRRVPDTGTAWEIARSLAIPVYDVQLTGYPRRMREWNARQRRD